MALLRFLRVWPTSALNMDMATLMSRTLDFPDHIRQCDYFQPQQDDILLLK
jgi:hypothetical protein